LQCPQRDKASARYLTILAPTCAKITTPLYTKIDRFQLLVKKLLQATGVERSKRFEKPDDFGPSAKMAPIRRGCGNHQAGGPNNRVPPGPDI
jgi:hypothetical protein